MKLCKCGRIVKGRCDVCYPSTHGRTTKERGYGQDHTIASKRYRAERPLCEVCLLNGHTKASQSMHHIVKIVDAPQLRMEPRNWLAVCDDCHELVENDVELARKAKWHGEVVYG